MAQSYTGGMTHGEAGFYGGKKQRCFLPRTNLGHKVDQFLYWVFCEEEEKGTCGSRYGHMHKDEVEALLDNASEDDIATFYEELNCSYMRSLSFFVPGGSSFPMEVEGGVVEKGSAIDQMKAFTRWYQMYQDATGWGFRVEGLDWLIAKFEAKKSN